MPTNCDNCGFDWYDWLIWWGSNKDGRVFFLLFLGLLWLLFLLQLKMCYDYWLRFSQLFCASTTWAALLEKKKMVSNKTNKQKKSINLNRLKKDRKSRKRKKETKSWKLHTYLIWVVMNEEDNKRTYWHLIWLDGRVDGRVTIWRKQMRINKPTTRNFSYHNYTQTNQDAKEVWNQFQIARGLCVCVFVCLFVCLFVCCVYCVYCVLCVVCCVLCIVCCVLCVVCIVCVVYCVLCCVLCVVLCCVVCCYLLWCLWFLDAITFKHKHQGSWKKRSTKEGQARGWKKEGNTFTNTPTQQDLATNITKHNDKHT